MSVPYRRYNRKSKKDGYAIYNNQRDAYYKPNNIYEKRLAAQRRNKMYKRMDFAMNNYDANNQYNDDNNNNNNNNQYHIADKHNLEPYSGDENESVDSVKKWKKLKSAISSIYIPNCNKNKLYDQFGHIMYLICIKGKLNKYNQSQFNLQSFIQSITNRSQNVMQRAKLLKVEVINENNNNNHRYSTKHKQITGTTTLRLRITISSPHTFQRLMFEQQANALIINNMEFKYEIPEIYHIQSQMISLNLCIKPFAANQGIGKIYVVICVYFL